MGGKKIDNGSFPDNARPSNPFFGKGPSLKTVIGSGINWLGGVVSGGVSEMQKIKPPQLTGESKETYWASRGKGSAMNEIKPPQHTATSAGISGKKTRDGYTYSGAGASASGKSAGISEPRDTSRGYTFGNSTMNMKDIVKEDDNQYLMPSKKRNYNYDFYVA